MKLLENQQVSIDAPPAGAGTTVGATVFKNLKAWDKIVIDLTVTGSTGGTTDIYLQRKMAPNVWRDWVHFPQIVAATTKKYNLVMTGEGGTTATITEVGEGNDAAPGVALAANSATNVPAGGDVRVVFVIGVGASAPGTMKLLMSNYSERY